MPLQGSEPRNTGGGAATAAGIDFQNRVAAWFAIRLLAETEAEPLWDWPASSVLKFLRCETEQPVDDILIGNSIGDLAFVQVKRGVGSGTGSESALVSAFNQFVRQYLRSGSGGGQKQPWDRKFDHRRDRLVLAVSRDSARKITDTAPEALRKFVAASVADLNAPQLNSEEQDIIARMRSCVEAGWQSHLKRQPDESELRDLLSSVRIAVLDIEAGGSDERHAKEMLRRTILSGGDAVEAAWSTLVQLCAGFAASRGGADGRVLRTQLGSMGLSLKSAPSYRADIRKLEEYTGTTIKSLTRFSEIQIRGKGSVKFQRGSTKALRSAVNNTSFIVIGEPGAGKSGALHDLVSELLAEGQPVLCLATDEIASESLAQLHDELHVEHALLDVIENWGSAERPLFVVTDALDAARTDHAGSMFRSLIERIFGFGPTCRVVASMRMFDLQNDSRLKVMFKGKPHREFYSDDFPGISHFLVPVLSNGELNQIAAQSAELDRLVQAVLGGDNADMKGLIVVPFNLRLLGELVGEGATIDSLTPIRTQIELLDRYWRERVIRTDKIGDARESLLRKVGQIMFRKRTLYANRAELNVGRDESVILQELLSSNLLQVYGPGSIDGLGRQTLKFSHHLIFDYALARLLMRVSHVELEQLISSDPDCVVAFRPSLVLHFRYLWSENLPGHDSFWSLLIRLEGASGIPLVGKIIGPSVAAELFARVEDCAHLFAQIRTMLSSGSGGRLPVQMVSHLLGAQAARGGISRTDDGAEAERWGAVAAELASNVQAFAYPLRHLLTMLCNPADGIPQRAASSIGIAGRKLLDFTLAAPDTYDSGLVRCAAEAISRSFASDPIASAKSLRKLLAREHAEKYGHIELFFVAQEVKRLAICDAALVGDLYDIAYTAASDKTDQTFLGGGRSQIMPLLSNVRQDWQSVHYSLGQAFSAFLAASPANAIRAAIIAIESHVEKEHKQREPAESSSEILFLGKRARLMTDFSSIWDAEGSLRSREGSALGLLDEVEEHLEMLADEPQNIASLLALLDIFREQAHSAVAWRRILRLGDKKLNTIGALVWDLVTQDAVIGCFDLRLEVGNLITGIYPQLSSEERRRIEEALIRFPERVGGHRESDEELRDRFLGCIPIELVETGPAKQRLVELNAAEGPPQNVPNYHSTEFTESIVGDEDYLRHRGVPVDEPANKSLLALIKPLKVDSSSGAPKPPPSESPALRLTRLKEIEAALVEKTASDVVMGQAFAYHAEACAAALIDSVGTGAVELKLYAREVLLSIAEKETEGPLTTNDQFDRMPSWGSPNAPISAAEGLLRSKDVLSPGEKERVDSAIDRLSRSPEPEIRFQVARYAGYYASEAPTRMWQLLRFFAESDPSAGVVAAALALICQDASPISLELVEKVHARNADFGEYRGPRESCLAYFLRRYVRDQLESAKVHLQPMLVTPWKDHQDTQFVLGRLREGLAFGPADSKSVEEAGIRKRAQELTLQILKAADLELERMVAIYKETAPEAMPADEKAKFEAIHRCINSVGDQVYFASGAFEQRAQNGTTRKLDEDQRKRFWVEMGEILRVLSRTRSVHVSYHLIETLEALIQFAPKQVFIEIASTVRSAKAGGFQYEGLVADMAVRIVAEFIATQRNLLKDDKECRAALVEILDTFVEAGWPSAQKLTFGLEDIFR